MWTFEQLIGIYYVQVPIRMTCVAYSQGLMIYAPVAPTQECLSLLAPLIEEFGEIKHIILPSVAVEHKVNAGPFARKFPLAEFWAVDKQYAFPLNLPSSFLGLPSWTKPLPSRDDGMWGDEFAHAVLTVKPGPGSMYQDVAMWHKPSKTLLLCDALFGVSKDPPEILTAVEEHRRALLFHARDARGEMVPDSREARRKGWRRIVLLFDFFFVGSARTDLGLKPLLAAASTPLDSYGWGGWMPVRWTPEEERDFEVFRANGAPAVLPIIQIILSRAPDAVREWVDVVRGWDFDLVIPAHLDSPLELGPRGFAETFDFVKKGRNDVRFCDEDVEFLRGAEEGFLGFSVYNTPLGVLRGKPCGFDRDRII